MTRPIEFRVWDTIAKQMNDYDDRHIHDGNIYIDQRGNVHIWCTKNYESIMEPIGYSSIIMQFTGLLDRNGNKIFEGDILKNDEGIYTVQFDYGAFVVEMEDSELDNLIGIIPDSCEIIGNIYENPELLGIK